MNVYEAMQLVISGEKVARKIWKSTMFVSKPVYRDYEFAVGDHYKGQFYSGYVKALGDALDIIRELKKSGC